MMKNLLKSVLFAALFLPTTMLLHSCKKTTENPGNSTDNFDRGALLSNYTEGYIIPAYNNMENKISDLQSKVALFASSPDSASLSAVRLAWRSAYITWQGVDLLEFGPDESISLRSYFNIYPTTPSKINANITSGGYNLEEFGNKDAQGFPALDYLLNGIAGTDSEILSYYTTDAEAAKRKQYMKDIADKMLSKINAVKIAWETYKTDFVNNTATDANSSISIMTNAFVLYYERYLRAGKVGLPVGALTGVATPEITESFYTPDLCNELAIEALNSIEKFYTGTGYNNATDGLGYKDYLTTIGTKDNSNVLIADIISSELAEAKSTLSTFSPNLKQGITSDRTAVLNIYQQLQDVVPLLKVDLISALGISITYTDNDGD